MVCHVNSDFEIYIFTCALRDLMLKPAGRWMDPYFHLLIHCILIVFYCGGRGDRTAAICTNWSGRVLQAISSVMPWRQAQVCCPSQWRPRSMLPYGTTMPKWIKTYIYGSHNVHHHIIARVYRLSAVYLHCQVTRYSQRVPGYLCQPIKSLLTKNNQTNSVFQLMLGLEEHYSASPLGDFNRLFEGQIGVLFKIWHWNMIDFLSEINLTRKM